MTRKELRKLRKSINGDIRMLELLMMIMNLPDAENGAEEIKPSTKEGITSHLNRMSDDLRAAMEQIASEIEALKNKI